MENAEQLLKEIFLSQCGLICPLQLLNSFIPNQYHFELINRVY